MPTTLEMCDTLSRLGACAQARRWIRHLPISGGEQEAWDLCERPEWMLWYLLHRFRIGRSDAFDFLLGEVSRQLPIILHDGLRGDAEKIVAAARAVAAGGSGFNELRIAVDKFRYPSCVDRAGRCRDESDWYWLRNTIDDLATLANLHSDDLYWFCGHVDNCLTALSRVGEARLGIAARLREKYPHPPSSDLDASTAT